MKTTHLRLRRITTLVLLGAILISGILAPAGAQAAVAQVRVSAEVIDPAVIDSSRLLAAAAKTADSSAGTAPAQKAQPEVKVVTVDGVTWLSIDYN